MKRVLKVKLRVAEAVQEDVYKDIARVHWKHRGHPSIKVGAIVKLSIEGKPARYVAMRGQGEKDIDNIFLDFVLRNEMKLELGEKYEFTIQETGPIEKLKWACTATDPAARIAAWIAVWSGIVGIIGLILGIIGVMPVVKDWAPSPIVTVAPSTAVSSPPRQ